MILDPSNEQESISERPFVVCFENEKDRFRFVNLLRAFQYSGVDRHEVDTAYLVGQNVDTKHRIQNDYTEMAKRRVSCTENVLLFKENSLDSK